MRVEAQDSLEAGETAVAEATDGTRLLRTEDGGGVVRPGPESQFARVYDSWHDARLMFGLWLRTGAYSAPESPSRTIPVEVAREGQAAIAAYLLVGTGVRNSRGYVASTLGVSEQTVSNYASRIRWSPDE